MALNRAMASRREVRPYGNDRRNMLLFRCSCGDEFWVLDYQPILDKRTGLCVKCTKQANAKHQGISKRRKRSFEGTFNYVRSKAKIRGIPCGLTYEEFLLFTAQKFCHYCDSVLYWAPHQSARYLVFRSNLDRKDNALGYSVANCVACCPLCNRIKSDVLSYDEMMELRPILQRIMAKRNLVPGNRCRSLSRYEIRKMGARTCL